MGKSNNDFARRLRAAQREASLNMPTLRSKSWDSRDVSKKTLRQQSEKDINRRLNGD